MRSNVVGDIEGGDRMYDFVVVGAGLFGCTFAYNAKRAGKRVLVIDKREHLGGNVYCRDEQGINVHQYGAHIFHTDDAELWKFVNSIVPFNRYTNCPVANYKGKLYNLPFNMNTFYQLWGVTTPEQAMRKVEQETAQAVQALGGRKPANLEEQALTMVGRDIYEKLVKSYTEKQWGRKCTELDPSIIRRLPLRFTFDNNYFNDSYQGIPIGGYNKLIDGLLDGVDTEIGVDYLESRHRFDAMGRVIVYTGPLDAFYGYRFGRLEYRTVRFEDQALPVANWQGNAVVNYTDETPYTRIIEHKHFQPESPAYKAEFTVISKEYSSEWRDGAEPFYPISDEKNLKLYGVYKDLALKEERTLFGGRLADYKYYDMDDVMLSAQALARRVIDFSVKGK